MVAAKVTVECGGFMHLQIEPN